MMVPILHSLCVKIATENSGEVKTMLGRSVRLLSNGERNASHSFGPLLVVGSIILWNGVSMQCGCVK